MTAAETIAPMRATRSWGVGFASRLMKKCRRYPTRTPNRNTTPLAAMFDIDRLREPYPNRDGGQEVVISEGLNRSERLKQTSPTFSSSRRRALRADAFR